MNQTRTLLAVFLASSTLGFGCDVSPAAPAGSDSPERVAWPGTWAVYETSCLVCHGLGKSTDIDLLRKYSPNGMEEDDVLKLKRYDFARRGSELEKLVQSIAVHDQPPISKDLGLGSEAQARKVARFILNGKPPYNYRAKYRDTKVP